MGPPLTQGSYRVCSAQMRPRAQFHAPESDDTVDRPASNYSARLPKKRRRILANPPPYSRVRNPSPSEASAQTDDHGTTRVVLGERRVRELEVGTLLLVGQVDDIDRE